MTDTIVSEIEYAVLCMCEKSKGHVTADFMCVHARKTGLKLFTSAELAEVRLPRRVGVYVVPTQDEGGTIQLKLLEVSDSATRIRDTKMSISAGLSVKYRWLFKR